MDTKTNATREKLIKLVEQSGKEITEKAKYIVGDGENLSGLEVSFSVSVTKIPTIKVTTEYPIIMQETFNDQEENHD